LAHITTSQFRRCQIDTGHLIISICEDPLADSAMIHQYPQDVEYQRADVHVATHLLRNTLLILIGDYHAASSNIFVQLGWPSPGLSHCGGQQLAEVMQQRCD
jgi:hypothetical protein